MGLLSKVVLLGVSFVRASPLSYVHKRPQCFLSSQLSSKRLKATVQKQGPRTGCLCDSSRVCGVFFFPLGSRLARLCFAGPPLVSETRCVSRVDFIVLSKRTTLFQKERKCFVSFAVCSAQPLLEHVQTERQCCACLFGVLL